MKSTEPMKKSTPFSNSIKAVETITLSDDDGEDESETAAPMAVIEQSSKSYNIWPIILNPSRINKNNQFHRF